MMDKIQAFLNAQWVARHKKALVGLTNVPNASSFTLTNGHLVSIRHLWILLVLF